LLRQQIAGREQHQKREIEAEWKARQYERGERRQQQRQYERRADDELDARDRDALLALGGAGAAWWIARGIAG